MMRLESTGQSLLKGLSFGAHLAQGQFGQHSGINFVLEQGREHCPSRLAHQIAGDYGNLILASSKTFCKRLITRERSSISLV